MHMQVWLTDKKCTCACFQVWIIIALHPALQAKVQFYYPIIVASSSTCESEKLDTKFAHVLQQTVNLKSALIQSPVKNLS